MSLHKNKSDILSYLSNNTEEINSVTTKVFSLFHIVLPPELLALH
jgi:hypothetical protein